MLSRARKWRKGQEWLSNSGEQLYVISDSNDMPVKCITEIEAKDWGKAEFKSSATLLIKSDTWGICQIINCEDFSYLNKLIRVTVYVLTFLSILKRKYDNSLSSWACVFWFTLIRQRICGLETIKPQEICRMEETVWTLYTWCRNSEVSGKPVKCRTS